MSNTFPPGFFIGTATAGHQIEGGNVNSDCWALEQVPDSVFRHRSGDAVDFYHRWRDDLALAADLGLRAFRFSVEWSRVEPTRGEFSHAALDHYRRLAATCRELGMQAVVTFNHWTTPLWFAADGGWTHPKALDAFERYVDVTAAHLAGEVDWAITLNEPNVATVAAVGGGGLGGSSVGSLPRALENATRRHPATDGTFTPMMLWDGDQLGVYTAAHRRASAAIKTHLDVPVGWSLASVDYQAVPGQEDRWAEVRDRALTDWLLVSRDDDFVGVQNYTRRLVGANGVQKPAPGVAVDDLNWEFYPQSLANAARNAAAVTGRPVLITEHGVCTRDDSVRLEHTRRALAHLADAIADGVDVRGYLHWTLLDEFEWFSGYDVTFGLVEVDLTTFERRPLPSATWLGELAARR